jgi:hypothetical protein
MLAKFQPGLAAADLEPDGAFVVVAGAAPVGDLVDVAQAAAAQAGVGLNLSYIDAR